jgi:hypothetical protein
MENLGIDLDDLGTKPFGNPNWGGLMMGRVE